MAIVAPYVDGELQTTTASSDSLSGTSSSSSNSVVDSDTFLTLLVAEMQNQDPLEPTSNTEWVSQYATFTQVEQMSEMADSMDLVRANSLIGKEVIMKVTSESTGETSYVRGPVDYVLVENDKPLLVINENKYSLSDLDTVATEKYFDAYDKYTEFVSKLEALPAVNSIDSSYQSTIQDIADLYKNMTDYEKEYLEKFASDSISSYKSYVSQMEKLGYEIDEEVEEELTISDAVSTFNYRMDSIASQLDALKEAVAAKQEDEETQEEEA